MKRVVRFVCFALAIGCLTVNAADEQRSVPEGYEGIAESTPPNKIDWKKRARHGSKGNITVYVDKDGVPTEIYVIGVAPVATTLTPVEAEEEAFEEVNLMQKLFLHYG